MPKAGYNQLSYYQRLCLKEMLESGYTKVEMAKKLQVHRSTIFNELKRGTVDGVYDPAYSEEKRLEGYSEKKEGKTIIKRNPELAAAISKMILKERMSPEKIVAYFKDGTWEGKEYPKSPSTIYEAIDRGEIPNVTRENLETVWNGEIVAASADGIRITAVIRRRLGIKKGDRFRISRRKNGEIVLKKITG